MHDGADHEPSSSRATTRPDPALPLNTKPALRMVKTAKPARYQRQSVASCVVLTLGTLHDLGWDLVDAIDRVAQLRCRLSDLRCELAAYPADEYTHHTRRSTYLCVPAADPCRRFLPGSPPEPRRREAPRIAPRWPPPCQIRQGARSRRMRVGRDRARHSRCPVGSYV